MAKIAWFIPGLIEGSGGIRTIVQFIQRLEQAGHQCSIYMEQGNLRTPDEARAQLERYFSMQLAGKVHLGFGISEPCDLAFATIWYTAKVVRDLPFPCKRAYFIQDYEAYFHPMGDSYLAAENSYRYGLAPITIGRWLQSTLAKRYGLNGRYFDFCADTGTYRPLPQHPREPRSVCMIYQPEKPRRCPVLGIETLGIVKHLMPDVEIHLYGSREKGHVWFPHHNHGLLDLAACNRLYNSSTVGFCQSASNPSRIPFEMMAAGLPVVELWRENNIFDLPDSAVQLCDQTPESLAKGIIELLKDPDRRQRMSVSGVAFMQHRDLEVGYKQFLVAVDELLNSAHNSFSPSEMPSPQFHAPPVLSEAFSNTMFDPSQWDRPPHPLDPAPPRDSLLRRVLRPVYRRLKRWI